MSNFPQSGSRRVELEYGTTDRTMFNFFNAVYAWMAVGLCADGGGRIRRFAIANHAASGVRQPRRHRRVFHRAGDLFDRDKARRNADQPGLSTFLFLLYARCWACCSAEFFLAYRVETLLASFFVTGGVFAGMSIYGYITSAILRPSARIASWVCGD